MNSKEDKEQEAFFDWVKWNLPSNPVLAGVYAIPNGGKRHIRVAVKLKKTGAKKGVMDVHFPYPTKEHVGLWIEFKVRPGKLTPDQKQWGDLMHSFGHMVSVAWSADEAIQILKNYLGKK